MGWGKLLWRTVLVMGSVAWGISIFSLPLAFAAGALVYPPALAPLVPGPLRFVWARSAPEL